MHLLSCLRIAGAAIHAAGSPASVHKQDRGAALCPPPLSRPHPPPSPPPALHPAEPLFQLLCHGVPNSIKAAINDALAAMARVA